MPKREKVFPAQQGSIALGYCAECNPPLEWVPIVAWRIDGEGIATKASPVLAGRPWSRNAHPWVRSGPAGPIINSQSYEVVYTIEELIDFEKKPPPDFSDAFPR
jgi:hypothetical protein